MFQLAATIINRIPRYGVQAALVPPTLSSLNNVSFVDQQIQRTVQGVL